MIPGVFNALTAKIAERLGYPAVYLSGGALSAGWAGVPDIGLLTLTEFTEQVAVLARATSLPLLCDADTGFGEAINVERTVRLYEDAGAAGLHIEDQVWICTDVFVGPGVRIGQGAVVGARSSVYRDLPPAMVCTGSPCRPVKPRQMAGPAQE